MSPTSVTLLSRPGCHLCDAARQIVTDVLAEFPAVEFAEQSIVDDPQLLRRYAEEIPVVLIDGEVHNIWHVDADRFRSALVKASIR